MRGASLLLILFVVLVAVGLGLAAGPILAIPFVTVVALVASLVPMRHRIENMLRVRRFRSQAVDWARLRLIATAAITPRSMTIRRAKRRLKRAMPRAAADPDTASA